MWISTPENIDLPAMPTLEAVSACDGHDEITSAYRQLFRTAQDLRQLVRRNREIAQALMVAHHTSLVQMAQAAEFKDGDTGIHMVRIGQLSARLAYHLGVEREECAMLCRAAPMHDIGKIGVPDNVLKKPGSLTEVEWQLMRLHPEIGARLLHRDDAPVFGMAADIALGHHERWDGAGYPHGAAREAIPLSARIVGLVDYYDALTMDRCYRPAMPEDTVLAMIAENAGGHFDPGVAQVFLEHAAEMAALRDSLNEELAGNEHLELETSFFVPR